MSDVTINDLAEVTTIASGDFVAIWRTANADTRKISRSNLYGGLLTGGGTIATGGFTLTVPKTGTAVVGTGTSGRIASFSDTNTLAASTLAKSGAGVLTLSAAGAYTLTVPATGTAVTLDATQTLSNKTLTTPTISATGFTNAQHAHTGATSGGQLTTSALSDLSTLVQTTGTQTIAGLKTFSNDIRGNEHFLMGTSVPDRHTVSSGYKGLWADGNVSLLGVSTAGFEGWRLDSNVVRQSDGWYVQDTSLPGWQLAMSHGSTADSFAIFRAAASASVLSFVDLLRLKSDGNFGLGTSTPQGRLHAHDGTGGMLFVTKTGITGTAQTIIPDGTGDVVRGCYVTGVYYNTNGDAGRVAQFIANNDSYDIEAHTLPNTRDLTLAVSAGGTLTAQRTSGSDTWTLALQIIWL